MHKTLSSILLVLLFLICCHSGQDKDIQVNTGNANKTMQSNLPQDQAVPLLDRETFEKLIAQHTGKILVINVWATWCMPCKEEFPALIQMASEYPESQVTVVGLSVDYPDEIDTKITPFLQQNNVGFTNYVQNFKQQEELIDLLNPDWRGAVPATFIYDTTGQQKVFLPGKQSFSDFKSAIEKIRQAD